MKRSAYIAALSILLCLGIASAANATELQGIKLGGGVLWNGWYWADNPRYTGGGWPWGAGGSNGEHGGAGGGGFGGGGAAEGSGVNHIGGGGGGGSLAAEPKREYGEDSQLFQGPMPPSDFDGAGGVVLTFQLQ